MRDDLPWLEERRGRIEQGEMRNHVLLVQRSHYHHQNIDDDDVLDSRRYRTEEAASPVV